MLSYLRLICFKLSVVFIHCSTRSELYFNSFRNSISVSYSPFDSIAALYDIWSAHNSYYLIIEKVNLCFHCFIQSSFSTNILPKELLIPLHRITKTSPSYEIILYSIYSYFTSHILNIKTTTINVSFLCAYYFTQ